MITFDPFFDDYLTEVEQRAADAIKAQMDAMAKGWDMVFESLEKPKPKDVIAL